MSVHGPASILFCLLLSMLTILTPASSHPPRSQCKLTQRTALCNNSNLTSVPVGLPASTEELQLNDNLIKTLHDNSLHYPSLTTLSLACNHLEKLHANTFQHSKLLKGLNLANNNLDVSYLETSSALKTLRHLKSLDLSVNKLDEEMTAVLLQNLTSLEYLNLSGNLLRRLDESSFRDLQQLKELDLQRNLLFEIDNAFDNTPRLQRLNLALNYLPCLMDFHMTQLVVLNASHNFIEWFISRQEINDTFQLETLDLSDNNLLFFPFLPTVSRLRNLYLSHNIVSFYEHLDDNVTFPNLTATVKFYNLRKNTENITAKLWDDSLHGDISSVEILDLRANQLQYFPHGFIHKMPSLSRLRMCTNCLESLNLTSEQFSGNLYELDVSNNRLKEIVANDVTLRTLSNLTYVNLSMNELDCLSSGLFFPLPSLRSVDLSYNNICLPQANSGLAWKVTASLRKLYLKGCHLARIPPFAFSGLSLTHLELSENPGLRGQESIKILSRTLNHLGLGNTHVGDLDFRDFVNLKSLNISCNSLAHLPASILSLDLKELDLRENKLTTIPSDQANTLASKLHTVFLTGNPFNCCQSEWFRTFEATKTIHMVGQSDIECMDLSRTHSIRRPQTFFCHEEYGESIFWYILLFVPLCICFVVISMTVLCTVKPKVIQRSIKKKYLKPTSY
ncbi:transforming growth factor beta activator LRRC33 [Corythoichthys intestinalis]|uniref:transforming growth factor beta activator LRRC33 n=1 Tax=Corythoichthys intestinalis TaxID=161448 RepID=UPI0025A5EC1A|nr:transforming growth factor beta activator LRRC33 [Corythoichthys intestinalis]XP_061811581.1 transforming growth factor beta activator LRRC33-like [Nerophis lumbriciformis]